MESDIFSYSPEIFEKVYKEIYSQIFQEHYPANHQAIILGGQPGAGKSFQSLLYRGKFRNLVLILSRNTRRLSVIRSSNA